MFENGRGAEACADLARFLRCLCRSLASNRDDVRPKGSGKLRAAASAISAVCHSALHLHVVTLAEDSAAPSHSASAAECAMLMSADARW